MPGTLLLQPVTIAPHTAVGADLVCILHGDIHPLRPECEAAALDWLDQRGHLDDTDLYDAYQAAAEQKMLDNLV